MRRFNILLVEWHVEGAGCTDDGGRFGCCTQEYPVGLVARLGGAEGYAGAVGVRSAEVQMFGLEVAVGEVECRLHPVGVAGEGEDDVAGWRAGGHACDAEGLAHVQDASCLHGSARAVRGDHYLLAGHGFVEGGGSGFEDGVDFCRPFESAARFGGVRLAGVESRRDAARNVHARPTLLEWPCWLRRP